MVQLPTCEGDIRISQNLMKTLKNHISWMDYPFLSKFWMFIAKKYSTFNEFIFFSEYTCFHLTFVLTMLRYLFYLLFFFLCFCRLSWGHQPRQATAFDGGLLHFLWTFFILSFNLPPVFCFKFTMDIGLDFVLNFKYTMLYGFIANYFIHVFLCKSSVLISCHILLQIVIILKSEMQK